MPQNRRDFLRDVSVRWLVGRSKGRGELPPSAGSSLRGLLPPHPPAAPGSVRGMVANMLIRGGVCPHIDLEAVHLDSSFACDHEVRLAARMVLDYVSAHMAVSMSDGRRMVPFRRRNEGEYVARDAGGHMTTGLLDWQRGCDPLTEHMAVHTGATRAFRVPSEPYRPLAWSMDTEGGTAMYEMLADYRTCRMTGSSWARC